MPKQAYRFCFCFKRMFKLKLAEPPKEIVEIFSKFSDKGFMTTEMLKRFLMQVQGEENATIDDAQRIVDTVKRLSIYPKGLDLEHFFEFLFGDLNPPIPELEIRHDMGAPLAHYFMYTGHNSYLTGNQLSSRSSVLPIIRSLRRGVRVIELDLWPNSRKDDVLVLHGGTLTSPVKLIKCLKAIKDNAFYASKYPVIITFEDHLNSALQSKVAEMVKSTFGEMLVPAAEYLEEFPSPESLKEKILISTKPPKTSDHDTLETVMDSGVVPIRITSTSTMTNEEEEKHDNLKHDDEEEEEDEEESHSLKYDDLIAIRAIKMKEKGGLVSVLKQQSMAVARLSLSEQRLMTAVKTLPTDIVRFTQRNLLRIYPRGSRVFSSNYNPLIAWSHGAQMVAFNMQGYEKQLWIMQGMFRANGGCGYVKKPDILLNPIDVFDPSIIRPAKQILKVTVYMGDGWALDFTRTHFDQFSPPDFFVKLQIYGVPADKLNLKTMPREDEWVPVWNTEFEFPLTVPELALLRIEVREYDMGGRYDFAGQTCLPVSELRTGIRAVPLYDRKGNKYKHVRLLMRFQIH